MLVKGAPKRDITELLHGEMAPYYNYVAEVTKGITLTNKQELRLLEKLNFTPHHLLNEDRRCHQIRPTLPSGNNDGTYQMQVMEK